MILRLVIALETSLRHAGSYKYQFGSHWFNPTLNQTPSLPLQKQTLYIHSAMWAVIIFSIHDFATFKQVHHRRIGKCVVDTLTFENALLLLEQFLNDYFFAFIYVLFLVNTFYFTSSSFAVSKLSNAFTYCFKILFTPLASIFPFKIAFSYPFHVVVWCRPVKQQIVVYCKHVLQMSKY